MWFIYCKIHPCNAMNDGMFFSIFMGCTTTVMIEVRRFSSPLKYHKSYLLVIGQFPPHPSFSPRQLLISICVYNLPMLEISCKRIIRNSNLLVLASFTYPNVRSHQRHRVLVLHFFLLADDFSIAWVYQILFYPLIIWWMFWLFSVFWLLWIML